MEYISISMEQKMEIQDLVKQSLNRNVNDNGSLRMENATGKTIRKEFKKYCTVLYRAQCIHKGKG